MTSRRPRKRWPSQAAAGRHGYSRWCRASARRIRVVWVPSWPAPSLGPGCSRRYPPSACISQAVRRSARQTSRISHSRARSRRSRSGRRPRPARRGSGASSRRPDQERRRRAGPRIPLRSERCGSARGTGRRSSGCGCSRSARERRERGSTARERSARSAHLPATLATAAAHISASSSWFILQTIRAGRPASWFSISVRSARRTARACASARRPAWERRRP